MEQHFSTFNLAWTRSFSAHAVRRSAIKLDRGGDRWCRKAYSNSHQAPPLVGGGGQYPGTPEEETSIVGVEMGVSGPGDKCLLSTSAAVERHPAQPYLGTQSPTACLVGDHDTRLKWAKVKSSNSALALFTGVSGSVVIVLTKHVLVSDFTRQAHACR